MCCGEARVQFDGAAEEFASPLVFLHVEPSIMQQAPVIAFPCVKPVRGLAGGTFAFGPFHRRQYGDGDVRRYLILYSKDVEQITVIAVGPKMPAARYLNQLRRYAHTIADLADTALQHVAHAELSADLLQVDVPALVGECGIARDDEQSSGL